MKKLKKLYFEHDFDARNSTTIKKIAKEIGLAGVGVYWILIEKLYEKNGVIDNEDVELLAWDFREDVSIFEGVIKIAFEKTSQAVLSILSEDAIEYLRESLGDLEKYAVH